MDREVSTTGPRLVLASGIALGLVMLAAMAATRSYMLAANYEVYRVAAIAALEGTSFYGVAPERFPDFFYLYPPITILGFLPAALVPLWPGFVLHTAVELLLGGVLAVVSIRWIERHRPLGRIDRVAITGFVIVSIHTIPSLVYGQVNLRMALLVAVGLYLLEAGDSDRDDWLAGAALGGAALYKVFPAIIGLWLVRQRAWRALGGSLVVGLGGLALGAAIFGLELTRTYFTDALLGSRDTVAYAGGLDPSYAYVTIARPISHLLPNASLPVATVLSALVLAPPVLYVYTNLETEVDRLLAAHVTVIAALVLLPAYPLYYVVLFGTLIPAMYLVRDRPSRYLLLAGAGLANVVLMGPTVEDLAARLSPSIGDPLLSVTMPILAVTSPMLLGCGFMTAGAVLHRYRRARDRRPS